MMMVRRGARPCVQPLRRSTTLRAWHLVPGAWQVVSGAPQRTPFPSALQPCQQRSIRRWSRSPCQLLRMHRRRAPRFEAGERSRPHPYRVAKVSALLEAPTPSPRPSPHSFGAGSTWALCRWRTSHKKPLGFSLVRLSSRITACGSSYEHPSESYRARLPRVNPAGCLQLAQFVGDGVRGQ